MPPVSDKTDLGHIDQSFVEEQPDLDLGDDDEDVEADGDDEIAAFAARLEESFVSLTPKVNRKKVKINTKDIFSL